MLRLSLFINYDGEIDEIAEKISRIFGMDIKKEIDEAVEVQRYTFRCFDIEFVLFDNHELEDDCGIKFSNYNYELDMLKLNYAAKHQSYAEAYNHIARFLTERLAYDLGANTMLVENLSKIVFSTIPTMART